ncbi:MAG: hypothetical protein QNJ81_14095, partial [Acidimicrobiia bacterium]|nr:hypothetical protein [Acidimicrobiia bacterium]
LHNPLVGTARWGALSPESGVDLDSIVRFGHFPPLEPSAARCNATKQGRNQEMLAIRTRSLQRPIGVVNRSASKIADR